jgi:hypothetical protein
LLLPEASSFAQGTARTALPASAPAVAPAAPARHQWRVNLLMGLVGGGMMLGVLLVGTHLWRPAPVALPITPVHQQLIRGKLIDEALRAVKSGRLDEATDLLQRAQGENPDPTVDLMIAALKRQMAAAGSTDRPSPASH